MARTKILIQNTQIIAVTGGVAVATTPISLDGATDVMMQAIYTTITGSNPAIATQFSNEAPDIVPVNWVTIGTNTGAPSSAAIIDKSNPTNNWYRVLQTPAAATSTFISTVNIVVKGPA